MTVLNSLYVDASDLEVKRQVLRAFMMAGDRQRVLNVALTEKAPELRTEAVHQLGVLGAQDELWQMYQKEPVRRGEAHDADGAGHGGRDAADDRSGRRPSATPSCASSPCVSSG